MRSHVVSGIVALTLATLGSAQTPIGPFLGKFAEGFSSQPAGTYACLPGSVFSGAGTLSTPDGVGATLTSSFAGNCTIQPLNGTRFVASTAGANGGGIELEFAGSTVAELGGWFAMNHAAGSDITVTFFSGATPVSSLLVPLPADCSWTWLGWEMGSLGIDRIAFKTRHPTTGFLAIDEMEANLMSGCAAAIYCTPKVNSLGCIPAIASSGRASPTSGSGYTVSCTNVRNNKVGLLLYRANGAAVAVPFSGGTLCVQAPVHRTPAVSSGGSVTGSDCTGVFAIDMNAFAVGSLGGNPVPELMVVGTKVNVQWWGRDPGFAAPGNTSLSDAIQYLVCP